MTVLPEPILDQHPEWVALYHAAWAIALRKVKHGTPQNKLAAAFMGEAFSNHLFQWDTCLMSLFARHAPAALPVLPALDNFYNKQHADGFICRELIELTGKDYFDKESDQSINPPLFAFAELGLAQSTGDLSHARKVLPRLVRYFDWIKHNRMAEKQARGMLWTSNLGSGMDNSPREARGWVCLTAQQALAADCIAQLAQLTGKPDLAKRFKREHRSLCNTLNTRSWSERDGYYWDVYTNGRHSHRKTIAAFWPLLAGVPTPKQAAKMVAHLRNPAEFYRPHLFPSLSADEQAYEHKGLYWLGGVWAPTNYAIIRGLQRAGYDDLAREAAESHLRAMSAVYASTGTIWETYAPEVSEPGNIARKDFVGWSGLGPIAMLIEHVIGLRADALRNRIDWVLRDPAEHYGVRGLTFGPHRVDMWARNGVLNVHTPVALTLVTHSAAGTRTHLVEAGENQLT